jgi:hypothetical protein
MARRLYPYVLALLSLIRPVNAQPAVAESQLVIEEALALLEAKKESLQLAEDKRVVDAGMAALRALLRPAKQDDEPNASVVISPARLRARFGGKAALHPKDKVLTLMYPFAAPSEFKDFEPNGSSMRMRNGFLSLDPGDDVKHIVKWKSVTVTCDLEVAQLRGPAVSTEDGFAVAGSGHFADWIQFRMPGGEHRDIQIESRMHKGRFPLRMELTPTRAMASYANAKLGKALAVHSVGRVSLRGGDSGYGFARVTFNGVPDEEWLRSFLADRDSK